WSQMLRVAGELWRSEVPIDTAPLFPDRGPRRIPLPTYPFERETYWIPQDADSAPLAAVESAAPERSANVCEWFYAPVYKQLPPARRDVPAAPEVSRRWIVLTGSSDAVAVRLVARLRARGDDVLCVRASLRPADSGAPGVAESGGTAADYARICTPVLSVP